MGDAIWNGRACARGVCCRFTLGQCGSREDLGALQVIYQCLGCQVCVEGQGFRSRGCHSDGARVTILCCPLNAVEGSQQLVAVVQGDVAACRPVVARVVQHVSARHAGRALSRSGTHTPTLCWSLCTPQDCPRPRLPCIENFILSVKLHDGFNQVAQDHDGGLTAAVPVEAAAVQGRCVDTHQACPPSTSPAPCCTKFTKFALCAGVKLL